MNNCKIVQLLILFVICNFCNKHFQVLGRHQWRCRAKVKEDVNESNYHRGDENNVDTNLPINSGQRNQTLKWFSVLVGINSRDKETPEILPSYQGT